MEEQDMSPKLNLFIAVLALLSLPALTACNTGGGGTAGVNEDMQAGGEGRGTDSVGEEGMFGEGTSGTTQQEEEGGATGAAEDEQGTSDAATMGTGGTGSAGQ
jgi:hypothetical protein